MNRTSLRRLCIAALLCAACTLMTAFLSVPTFITAVGNINLGDCVTLCACLLLGLWYGPAVGAVGGALADLLSGYTVYAPATLAAKFLMGLIACLILRPRKNAGFPGFWRSVLALLAGGVAMVLCYFLYELLLYGIEIAGTNVLFNFVQLALNAIVALALYPLLKKAAPRV